MKKADNFDSSKWLVENKITTQSRLNEEESNDVLTQEDFDILGNKGFEINFTQPRHQLFWLERKLNAERADFRYLENLLNKKNIPFRIEKRGYDGRGAAAKEIWIDTKYTDVPNPKVDTNESRLNEEKPTNDMVKDYWSIMVENQPEDVVKILVGLTNGDLPFEKFSLDTANDVYDSFKDESYDDEDED